MTKKNRRKVRTGIYLDCTCGAKSAVFENGECRWFAHCVSCGKLVFWSNYQLTERIKVGGKLCPHNPEMKTCKDGRSLTSWCEACRVRTFLPVFIKEGNGQ